MGMELIDFIDLIAYIDLMDCIHLMDFIGLMNFIDLIDLMDMMDFIGLMDLTDLMTFIDLMTWAVEARDVSLTILERQSAPAPKPHAVVRGIWLRRKGSYDQQHIGNLQAWKMFSIPITLLV